MEVITLDWRRSDAREHHREAREAAGILEEKRMRGFWTWRKSESPLKLNPGILELGNRWEIACLFKATGVRESGVHITRWVLGL